MVALPVPVYGVLFGREWFTEPGVAATSQDDPAHGARAGRRRGRGRLQKGEQLATGQVPAVMKTVDTEMVDTETVDTDTEAQDDAG